MVTPVTSRITDTDKGYNRLVRSIGDLTKNRNVLSIGIQGAEAGETHEVPEGSKKAPPTVGEIAAWAELGIGQPERSWLRGWYDEHVEEIRADLRTVTRSALEGKYTKAEGLELLGLKYVGQIQKRIADGIDPPNAESTIARKKSSTPLIDTGQLRSAVTYMIRSAQL